MVDSRSVARSFRLRAARALALFVATLFVTLLSPLVHGQAYERLCSARGDHFIAVDDAGVPMDASNAASHGAHCPLCLPAGAPPTAFLWTPSADRPDATPHARAESAHIAALVGSPFPPRAPPLVS